MAAEAEVLVLTYGEQWQRKTLGVRQLCQIRDALTGPVAIRLPDARLLNSKDLQDVCTAFGMSLITWEHQHRKATGFFSAHEHEEQTNGTRDYTTALRFLVKHVTKDQPKSAALGVTANYTWTEIGIWTQWRPSHSSVILCTVDNDDKAEAWSGVCKNLTSSQSVCASTPFGWHTFVIPQITAALDRSVWDCRDVVRYKERNRPSVQTSGPEYVSMHELARHTVHIAENVEMSSNVLEEVRQEAIEWQRATTLSTPAARTEWANMLRAIRCQQTLLQCAHGRACALTARLQNEINLAFHIGTERDSAIARQMASSMRQDSTAMKTISVLGLVYLPGTFGIFGMSFFDFSQEAFWTNSPKLWIYWATTIPLTLLTILTWYIWHRRSLREQPPGRS
ncbi:hypothetical protein LTS10_005963 [Elasticomyces elasticus]|nr:hypothetical protein LTS10_005963 [Elasticomyces elasticus]